MMPAARSKWIAFEYGDQLDQPIEDESRRFPERQGRERRPAAVGRLPLLAIPLSEDTLKRRTTKMPRCLVAALLFAGLAVVVLPASATFGASSGAASGDGRRCRLRPHVRRHDLGRCQVLGRECSWPARRRNDIDENRPRSRARSQRRPNGHCGRSHLRADGCRGRLGAGAATRTASSGTARGRITGFPSPCPGSPGHVLSIAVGLHHTCALTESGTLQCWGENANGQLGNSATADSSLPVTVVGLSSVAGVAAGGSHNLLRSQEPGGGVKRWGSNAHGQLGIGLIGGYRLTPVDVDGLDDRCRLASLSLGNEHSCAVTREGEAAKAPGAWTTTDSSAPSTTAERFLTGICTRPVQVDGLSSGMSAIAAGPDHTCARTSAGSPQVLGRRQRGTAQGGATATATGPLTFPASRAGGHRASRWARATHAHLTLAGDVACWGGNSNGRVGDGTRRNRSTPVSVLAGPTACVVPRLKEEESRYREECAREHRLLAAGRSAVPTQRR